MNSFDEDILPRLAPQWRRFATEYNWAGKGGSIKDAMPNNPLITSTSIDTLHTSH